MATIESKDVKSRFFLFYFFLVYRKLYNLKIYLTKPAEIPTTELVVVIIPLVEACKNTTNTGQPRTVLSLYARNSNFIIANKGLE